ncbi:hypothetical protein BDW59DRAFT_46661 [Aspergillus cavernicola]|uniref:Uncharacterized protein n=1 Tax=Aspergillus cavernicola TaxID=176166 RepID=A0ABR4J2T8_9EURO
MKIGTSKAGRDLLGRRCYIFLLPIMFHYYGTRIMTFFYFYFFPPSTSFFPRISSSMI